MIKKILILTALFLLQILHNHNPKTLYKIPEIRNPQQVIPVDDEYFIIVKDEMIYKYVFQNKTLIQIGTRQKNELVGVGDLENLIYCRFEHRLINSLKDYSTTFQILDHNKEIISEYEFFETIRPLSLDQEKIIAVTALDFLEEHYYEIDISTGNYKEISKPEENRIFFNIDLDWSKIYVFNQRMILQDRQGSLYAF